MRICSLSSGSKGNSLFIESDETRLLIDAGLSALRIKNSLLEIGVEPDTINAIIITHAHRDHVNGAGVFSYQFKTPIWGHPKTLDYVSYLFRRNQNIQPWGGPFQINNITLTPFELSHDAIPTVGYNLKSNNKSVAISTDLGIVTKDVEDNLKNTDVLVVESNHDPDLLKNGPYPLELKLRIAGHLGHLSNHESGMLLKKVLHGNLQNILLAHLSDENNNADLAKNTVLEYIGIQYEHLVTVIEQKKISPVIEF